MNSGDAINVCIPTRNRPVLLERAVDSLISDITCFSGDVRILVVDQSDADNAFLNTEILHSRSDKCSEIFYLGCKERESIIRNFSWGEKIFLDTLLPEKNDCYGFSRNWISLFFAGQRYCSYDDDVLIRSAKAILPSGGERSIEGFTPWGLLAYSSETNLMDNISLPGNSATLALHSSLDGSADTEKPIAFSSCGVAGHSGLSTHALCSKIGCLESRKRMFGSDRSFRRTIESSWVVRQAPVNTYTSMNGFIATAYCALNRISMIPFIPYGRGEDRIYSSLLQHLGLSEKRLELAQSVFHLPTHGRVPSKTIDVTSTASLILSFLLTINAAGTNLGPFFKEAEYRLVSPDWKADFLSCFSKYCTHQVEQLMLISLLDDLCGAAFRAVARAIEEFKATATMCLRADIPWSLENRIIYCRDILLDWLSGATSWDAMWNQALLNRSHFLDLCQIRPRN
ncbi:hypothetical protein [uncultured Xanthomonas sp.]|uniref:hypothetical protein n=1 Tax=uncultured Xanthomonas sp. TaxID=152831 RepID=UPI0025F57346|nr:hypothetical protein [uncultured Xanthomonas sp.]